MPGPDLTRVAARRLLGGVSVALTLLLGLSPGAARAAPEAREGFGLGVALGEPTGLTAKYWLDPTHALQFGLVYDFTEEAVGVYVDYLFHFDIGVEAEALELPIYVGVGGRLHQRSAADRTSRSDDATVVGVRVPVGVSCVLWKAPIELFVEVVPGARILPVSEFVLDGVLGARYYF